MAWWNRAVTLRRKLTIATFVAALQWLFSCCAGGLGSPVQSLVERLPRYSEQTCGDTLIPFGARERFVDERRFCLIQRRQPLWEGPCARDTGGFHHLERMAAADRGLE